MKEEQSHALHESITTNHPLPMRFARIRRWRALMYEGGKLSVAMRRKRTCKREMFSGFCEIWRSD